VGHYLAPPVGTGAFFQSFLSAAVAAGVDTSSMGINVNATVRITRRLGSFFLLSWQPKPDLFLKNTCRGTKSKYSHNPGFVFSK
jgi:hypothetical protein